MKATLERAVACSSLRTDSAFFILNCPPRKACDVRRAPRVRRSPDGAAALRGRLGHAGSKHWWSVRSVEGLGHQKEPSNGPSDALIGLTNGARDAALAHWRDSSGNLAVWLMNGAASISTGGLGNVGSTPTIASQRDFNGDGRYDLLWRDTSSARRHVDLVRERHPHRGRHPLARYCRRYQRMALGRRDGRGDGP
jgi:hypothetical protein